MNATPPCTGDASGRIVPASETAEGMTTACMRFLESLSPALRRKAVFALEDPERLRWHYVPREMFDRRGLSLGEMNDRTTAAALALLAVGLSPAGYRKATAIIALESILAEWEQRTGHTRLRRDPKLYFFSVFGDPSLRTPWAWRVEGHHLSLHFTVVSSAGMTASPFFFGANPAEVRHGVQRGQRILAAEEDLARQLVAGLDGQLRARAVVSAVAPDDILTRAAPQVTLPRAEGLTAEAMATDQREQLAALIRVYAERLPPALAHCEMRRLRNGTLAQVHFAWAGSIERGHPHYYRIQGPMGLVEYDNTQDNANHIHTVWRRPEADFGRDLLKLHYRSGHVSAATAHGS